MNCRRVTRRRLFTATLHLQEALSKERTKMTVRDNSKRRIRPVSWDKSKTFKLPEPALDFDYIYNVNNSSEISDNIAKRKGVGDINRVLALREETNYLRNHDAAREQHLSKLAREVSKIPNRTHPDVKNLTEPRLVSKHGTQQKFDFKSRTMENLAQRWRLLRNKEFGKLSCRGTYYLQGDLALLERALISYTMDTLMARDFTFISVPDILHEDIINACGVPTTGDQTMVYSLDYDNRGPTCLSGTAEMALAGLAVQKAFNKKTLPLKLAAVSRCYRSEADGWSEESGLYRVHEFNKVEMFVVTDGDVGESETYLQEVLHTQELLFSGLGLHYQVLEMPPKDLAAAAYHKYDIEAWMGGRQMYGEISSASNCTDYQSRRLHMGIRYMGKGNELKMTYIHTVNGTACAVPRLLIAIFEQNQQADYTVKIPEVLWPYMHGVKEINKKKCAAVERIRSRE